MNENTVANETCGTCKYVALVDRWCCLKCMKFGNPVVKGRYSCAAYEKRPENEAIGEAKGIEET